MAISYRSHFPYRTFIHYDGNGMTGLEGLRQSVVVGGYRRGKTIGGERHSETIGGMRKGKAIP